MKALAEAQNLTPELSSGAQARDRRPLCHLPVPPQLRVGCVSSFASEWLSFLWPRILSCGGLESGRSTAESSSYKGLCQPQASCPLLTCQGRGPFPKAGACPPGTSQAHPQAQSCLPAWCTPRRAASLILMTNQVMSRTWIKKGHSWSQKQLLGKKLAKSKYIPSQSRGFCIRGAGTIAMVTHGGSGYRAGGSSAPR